jgi:hypothetical protein
MPNQEQDSTSVAKPNPDSANDNLQRSALQDQTDVTLIFFPKIG